MAIKKPRAVYVSGFFGGAGGNRTLVQNVINIPSTSVARLSIF